MVRGNPHVLEGDGARVAAALPHVGFLFSKAQALTVGLDDESRHAPVACVRIGFGKHEEKISITRARNPHLGAVDDVFITVSACRRGDGGHVGTCSRLRDRIGRECPFLCDFAQPDLLLGFCGTGDDGCGRKRGGVGCGGEARVAPRQFFVDEDFFHATEPWAAVGFWNVEVEQPHFVRGSDGVDRVHLVSVPVFRVGANLIHGELVSQITQHLLHFVELEVDHATGTRRPALMLVNAHVAKMRPLRCKASSTRKTKYREISMAPSRRRKR